MCSGGAWRAQRPNPNILYGALVSGPSKTDTFIDQRPEYTSTEVALDFNTALTTAAAALAHVPDEFWASDCASSVPVYPWATTEGR
jgi:hypothetical protein